MKEGKAIVFVDADGDRHPATCARVCDDVSASGAKVLDVTIVVDEKPETYQGIPYAADRVEDEAYWQLTTDPVVDG